MSEVIYEEHSDAVWTEVGPEEVSVTEAPIDRITAAPATWPALHKAQLDSPDTGGLCRCWRCKGGHISAAERAAYDRILARHLVRLGDTEREYWLRQWSSVPTHGPDDIRTLKAWIAIERGKHVPEPTYSPRRAG